MSMSEYGVASGEDSLSSAQSLLGSNRSLPLNCASMKILATGSSALVTPSQRLTLRSDAANSLALPSNMQCAAVSTHCWRRMTPEHSEYVYEGLLWQLRAFIL